MRVPLAVAVLGLVSAGSALAQTPDLRGRWTLNAELSGDIAEKIKAAAGPASVSGGPSWASATETWFPWAGGFSEPQRVEMREFILNTLPVLQNVEIEQSPEEVKTIHGDAGVRTFYLTRKSSGSSAVDGQTVTRQARWQGSELILESKGKESRLTEVLVLVPTRKQLTYTVRFEHKLFKSPLELNLAYDQVAK
jgi:hypothetical protein